MSKTFNKKSFIIAQLRRSSYKYPPRNEALKKARIDRGVYQCQSCKKMTDRHDIRMDHVNPVVDPLQGWQGWDVFIERMFCDTEGFNAICNACHDIKTKGENLVRKTTRQQANAQKRKKRKADKIKTNPLLREGVDKLLEELKITKKK